MNGGNGPIWPSEKYEEIASRLEAGDSWEDIGADEGVTSNAARFRYLRYRKRLAEAPELPEELPEELPAPDVTIGTKGDLVSLEIAGMPRVTTVDEALERQGYVLAEWTRVEDQIRHYEVTLKGPDNLPILVPMSSIFVKMRQNYEFKAAARAMEGLIERVSSHAPKPAPRVATWRADDDLMLEVNLSDAHLALLAWGPEVGKPYDTDIAVEDWRYAVGQIVDIASHWRVGQIVLPTGNDLYHADTTTQGKGGQTTAGTPQDMDTRWPKMLETGARLLVETADSLNSIAPVHVRMVRGNHGERSEFMLGQVLDAWYRQDDGVVVENPASMRSAYQWGKVMIGYTHGHGSKPQDLPLIFADEYPDMWAATRWREIHLGHWHAAKAMSYAEFRGVRVVVVPGMTGTDSWHFLSGYRHQRCAEARLWSKTRGPVATFNVWLESERLAA